MSKLRELTRPGLPSAAEGIPAFAGVSTRAHSFMLAVSVLLLSSVASAQTQSPVLLIVKILYAVHDFTTDFVARC